MLSESMPTPLVSVDWLRGAINDPAVKVLDGSWYLPSQDRDAEQEFEQGHIPGAQRFDIDVVADISTGLPHMLPPVQEFRAALAALGIGPTDAVVVYDGAGLFSAARVWWMFRTMGFEHVSVLDGGLPAWTRAGEALHHGAASSYPAAIPSSDKPAHHDWPDPVWERYTHFDALRNSLIVGDRRVLDARPAGRFSGREPEPRAGLPSGHMPGALNLPFAELIDAQTGALRTDAELRARFSLLGVDPMDPIVCTCGSGVTACVLALAIEKLGGRASVYDGSWAEWGTRAPQLEAEPTVGPWIVGAD